MFKRKKTPDFTDDTQPIDYRRLAKEVVKEQKRQKDKRQAQGCLIFIFLAVGIWIAFRTSGGVTLPTARRENSSLAIITSSRNDSNAEAVKAEISFPARGFVVTGSVDIKGTVNSPTMRNYFVEFRPRKATVGGQWFPATLPRIESVVDDILGTWNTKALKEGQYELRLAINTGEKSPEYIYVGPVEVRNKSSATPVKVTAADPTVVSKAVRIYSQNVCPDRDVNMRKGAGYTQFEIVGQIQSGKSYKVVGEVEGENVFGNTIWYMIEHSGKTAYVTAHYMYACNASASAPRPTRESSEQATISYITTCNDEDVLGRARASKEFRHNEVRRAIAFCRSKQIMVDLKVNGVFDTLDETKREMYALLCALRKSDYGITFDVDGDFYDFAGNQIESRAVLARFEADVVGRINCDSYHGAVNWDYAAEEWWVHRGLSD